MCGRKYRQTIKGETNNEKSNEETFAWMMVESYLNKKGQSPKEGTRDYIFYVMWRAKWATFRDVLRKAGEIE